MFFYRFAFLLAFFASIFSSAYADEVSNAAQVRLQATAERAIAPDLLRITLYSEVREKEASWSAQTTTEILNLAIEKAREVANVTIQSGNRSSYPVYDDKGQNIIAWQERAELHLESADFATLVSLSTALRGNLEIASQQFLISKTLRRETENALMEEAIAAFGERAQIVTKALDGQSYKIVQIEFDGQNSIRPLIAPRNMMLMAASASKESVPQIEAGTSDVVVSLQGIIEVEM